MGFPKKCTEVANFVAGNRHLYSDADFMPFKSRIKAVVFDMDGTLTDSIGQIIDCTKRAFKAFELTPPEDNVIVGMIGKRLGEGIASILPKSMQDRADEVTLKYREIFTLNDEIHKAVLFPGIAEMLTHLKSHGYLIGIASGKSRVGIERTLSDTVLGSMVDAVCAGDEVPSKPDPKMMLVIAERLGVKCEEILGVGDAGMDIEMYRNAGCLSCAVQSGVWSGTAMLKLDPNLLIGNASELSSLLP